MVYILDEGSEFDAPLDRIWKYIQSDEEHNHTKIKPISVEMAGENSIIVTNEIETGMGAPVRNKIKMTMYPPFGIVQEYLEGPMTGTKSFQFYTPKGNKTGVTVVGNFVAQGMDDDMVKHIAMQVLDIAFTEDNENLKQLVVVS